MLIRNDVFLVSAMTSVCYLAFYIHFFISKLLSVVADVYIHTDIIS